MASRNEKAGQLMSDGRTHASNTRYLADFMDVVREDGFSRSIGSDVLLRGAASVLEAYTAKDQKIPVSPTYLGEIFSAMRRNPDTVAGVEKLVERYGGAVRERMGQPGINAVRGQIEQFMDRKGVSMDADCSGQRKNIMRRLDKLSDEKSASTKFGNAVSGDVKAPSKRSGTVDPRYAGMLVVKS